MVLILKMREGGGGRAGGWRGIKIAENKPITINIFYNLLLDILK